MKSQNSNVGKPASSSSEGCPSRHQLIGLLDETNAPDETVAEHVSLCTDCQTILDQLTDHDQLSDYKRQASKPRFSNFLDPAIRAGDLGRIGDLHVESQIGIGGMGVVFRGRDDSLNRTVAIKVLKPLSSAKAVQRFERESKAVGRISHDHVVPVYSTGRASDGSPYLVMPLIEGKTLKQRIVDGPIPVLDSVDIIRQVAEGLEAAHQEELIHRDVKPANILLDQRDNRAKLADFGLVRTADDSTLTQVDVICGTPEYISPEQITDAESTDARCDIYSLGITLYQCLTGSPPFRGLPLEILDQHRTEEPIPPSRLNREVPQDVETICLKAISKPRGKRYDTAAEFAADLSRWQNKEPILARPPSTIQRLGFLVRKNKALFLSLASILLVLAIATAVSVWFALVANRATNQAEKNLEVAKKRLGVVVDSIRLSNPELGADPSMSAKDLLVARLVTGQLEQAHDELEPLLELTKKQNETGAARITNTMQTLVSVKLHLGKNAEAKTLAQELVGELRKLDSEESDSRFPQRLAKGLACLAESYAANGNMNDAEKVCEELAALAFDDLLADSTMLGVRGAIEFDRENWNSAEELFIKSFERLDAERDDLENESLWVLQRASDRVLEFYQTDGIQIPFKPRKISIWKKRQSKTTKQIAEMLNPLGEMK